MKGWFSCAFCKKRWLDEFEEPKNWHYGMSICNECLKKSGLIPQ